MNKRRLLKLADLLEADAKNKKGIKFDLGTVISTDDGNDIDAVGVNCGTSACAMGLAALSGAFKRYGGLSYRLDQYGFIETSINGRLKPYDKAAMTLFGIGYDDANYLFTPSNYPADKLEGAVGERFVAKRIRNFVAGKVDRAYHDNIDC